MDLNAAGTLFGWETGRNTKTAADFKPHQLLARGWTKDLLLEVADAYDQIAIITPSNRSAKPRADQLREIAKVFE